MRNKRGLANGATCLWFGKLNVLGRLMCELDDPKNKSSAPRGWDWDPMIQILSKEDFDKYDISPVEP